MAQKNTTRGPALVVSGIDEAARVLSRGKVKSVQITLAAPTAVQMAKIRCSRNEATDADRILLARKSKDGKTMFGPDEVVPCDRHEGHTAIHRWTWDVPEDGDHERAIKSSEPDIVHRCPKCEDEDEAARREEIGDDGA